MSPARRSATLLAVVAFAMLAYGVWYVFIAHATPSGYEFPRHELSGGAPLVELVGSLEDVEGCIRADGATIVWPTDFWLGLDDGTAEVHGAERVVAVGDPVRLVGRRYVRSELRGTVPDDVADSRCPEPFFVATGFAD